MTGDKKGKDWQIHHLRESYMNGKCNVGYRAEQLWDRSITVEV